MLHLFTVGLAVCAPPPPVYCLLQRPSSPVCGLAQGDEGRELHKLVFQSHLPHMTSRIAVLRHQSAPAVCLQPGVRVGVMERGNGGANVCASLLALYKHWCVFSHHKTIDKPSSTLAYCVTQQCAFHSWPVLTLALMISAPVFVHRSVCLLGSVDVGYSVSSYRQTVITIKIGKVYPCTSTEVHRGSTSIALLFRDHDIRTGWGVSVTPQPLFTPGERPGTHSTGGWVGPRAGLDRCGKSRPPHRNSFPGPSSP
jgi:hypothetical protein